MYIFGPVPSRRLGKSLGVNVIPPKICSYSCVYCQLGRTRKLQIEPVEIYDIEAINKELAEKLKLLKSKGEQVDYLTFVADGEPTLAAGLGDLIDLIKVYGIKIAVITNSSLVWKEEVKSGLLKADWVSLKCDAVTEEIWQKIDRPYPRLNLERIKNGMIQFAEEFEGILATETMLIKDFNDKRAEIEKIAHFIEKLFPDFAYLSIPTRPPAEGYATAASYEFINLAYNIMQKEGLKVEYLIGYEGNEFSSTGDTAEDVLSISAVHPLKQEAVQELLRKNNGDWADIEKLISNKEIVEVEYEGNKYYIRGFAN